MAIVKKAIVLVDLKHKSYYYTYENYDIEETIIAIKIKHKQTKRTITFFKSALISVEIIKNDTNIL